jgi:hypothetical protein
MASAPEKKERNGLIMGVDIFPFFIPVIAQDSAIKLIYNFICGAVYMQQGIPDYRQYSVGF